MRILENNRDNCVGIIGAFIGIEEKNNRAKTRNNPHRPTKHCLGYKWDLESSAHEGSASCAHAAKIGSVVGRKRRKRQPNS